MKHNPLGFALAWLVLFIFQAPAAIYYVSQNGSNPTPPYAGWSTAATNIQDAIDAAASGDQVLVTNGFYSAGGLAMAGTLTNRVALNKPVTVQSVNGPFMTIIQGGGAAPGPTAVRCAWLTNGAVLAGFTLQGGATASSGATIPMECGGGVWCASSNAIVSNCLIMSNTAFSTGGGAYQGFYKNCLLTGNSSTTMFIGGAAYAVMNSCSVVRNSGSGVIAGIYTNCIVYSNSPSDVVNAGSFAYSCTPSPSGGVGNISASPQLFADGVRLLPGSPCIGAGTNLVSGTDIFGRSWANPPSMGCAEFQSGTLVASPQVQLVGNPAGFRVGDSTFVGQAPFGYSWLKDGVPLSDNGHFSSTQTTNLMAAGVSLADAGNYQFVVSNAVGVVTSAVTPLVIHCVAASGTNPVPPYLTWSTAATNIQDAITVASPGDVVLVTNGVYANGGISMDGVIVNCVSVNKGILVESVNGPNTTIIQGTQDPATINGNGAVRCAWLTNSAILAGFTLQGGATRTGTGTASTDGGGIYCASTNVWVYNCLITNNYAYNQGGGVYATAQSGGGTKATLAHCVLTGNFATGVGYVSSSPAGAGAGGGAYGCNLLNCLLKSNVSQQTGGGGAYNCLATNCSFTQNSSYLNGVAAYSGVLVNCTIAGNIMSGVNPIPVAVYGATLVNSIVYGNSPASTSNPNYGSCTMTYCYSDPLPSGPGNVDANPQLLADNYHLAMTSPCISMGTASVVFGTDIDGQAWKNPPAIGCDEWQPAPVIGVQPAALINSPAHGLTVSVVIAGQSPNYFWSLNGAPIQDDGHHGGSGTGSLVINNLGPNDAGLYQVVVSNAFGVVTSQVALVMIHAVNTGGLSPVPPYLTWATAATNIQDAIDAAAAGDIVLVTNGVYSSGGTVMTGNLTNRVALTKPLTVASVNGYAVTAIQGAWDPMTTNGPGAVRCAYVADGAALIGFTLQNGATRNGSSPGDPQLSGGGVCCNSANGVVVDCVLSNNSAIYGGGSFLGTLNNSCVLFNSAASGAGTYGAVLNNCTVINNYNNVKSSSASYGAGTYLGTIRNSIVIGNYDNVPAYSGATYTTTVADNYGSVVGGIGQFYYSCTSPTLSSVYGPGNTNVNPQMLDWFHLATTSPCRGAGSALYASGTDLDGEAWVSPPSMGCDEVIVSNLVGPLTVSIVAYQTNVVVSRYASFSGYITGRASGMVWNFGDGIAVTNLGAGMTHQWTNSGDYTLTYTAYNNDHPAGVSSSVLIHVGPLSAPQLQLPVLLANGFQFQFSGQGMANYTIQYATNLAPPVTWSTLQIMNFSTGGQIVITDPTVTNRMRFYRVLAQ